MRRIFDEEKPSDPRTIEEILNGLQGPNPSTEKTYSNDPDYTEVDENIFTYWDALTQFYTEDTQQ